MCGVAGIYHLDRRLPVEGETITRMCDVLSHRGPDDAGAFVRGHVGLGMRRLSIIDVKSGHQPMPNEDESIWVVCNGEIYNHNQLRPPLQAAGHRFRTSSDIETIVHLYEEHGVDCLRYLRGMFAFALWDARQCRLFAARDRLGIKPLFYTLNDNRLAFASEIKALLALPDVPRDPDWTAVDAYFTYGYIPAPFSGYASIRKLPPAHYLTADVHGVRIQRWWDLPFSPKHRGSEAQIAGDFRDLMGETVGMHLMSEVPLGAFLSGGVDSGVVVAMMGSRAAGPVHTFTVGFGGASGNYFDERPCAREVANRYGCRHAEREILPDIDEALDVGATAFDEPFADDSLIPTHHLCKVAKEEVTVILTGLGGDENFGGYERYLGFMLSGLYARIPRLLRDHLLGPLVRSLREEKGGHYRVNHLKRFVAGGALVPSRRYQSYLRAMDPASRRTLYSPEIAKCIDFERVEALGHEHFERLEDGDLLDRAIYQDMNSYLPEDILALTDRVGMHHSLELRVPFVDHEIVEYCARIPSGMKIRGLAKKHLLRRAAREFLPPCVFSHRKQGFASPMAAWLNSDLKQALSNDLSSERLQRQGVFAPAVVNRLKEEHAGHRQLNDKTLFALLVFQRWVTRGDGESLVSI